MHIPANSVIIFEEMGDKTKMTIRYPAYYDSFHCIAGHCEDTCCAGWEIDIDDKSYEYYRQVPGEFGERLRNNIREYEEEEGTAYEAHGFVLQKDRRCPFLNDGGLCDLYMELGEGALCDVCTNTPRNFMEYGGEREISISASCPEAARLIYGQKERHTFTTRVENKKLGFTESREEFEFACRIREARDRVVFILQNRDFTVKERVAHFLHFSKEVQNCLNNNDAEGIRNIGDGQPCMEDSRQQTAESGKIYRLFLGRMLTFSEMDSIREDWQELLVLLQKRYVSSADGAAAYERDSRAWQMYVQAEEREYEYEHLLVYYAFMCLPRCVDDYDFLGRAKLCVVSYLMVRDMDMAWYGETGSYTEEDRLRMARIYAKEVEHSEENLDFLAEEFLFEEAYRPENLLLSL